MDNTREKLIELLITADDYEDSFCECYACKTCPYHGIDCAYKVRADHLISSGVSIPVKCGECKYMIKQMGGCYCKIWQQYNSHGDAGFCSYGERKEEDGKG